MKISIGSILVDNSISPRSKLNTKHVEELKELEGVWPPILVRPIVHQLYQYQLIDGFHRTEAADQLGHITIDAHIEEMDDATALARALRENLHGMPMTAQERKDRVVILRKLGWTQEQIAKETGITLPQISKYLAAERVEEELLSSRKKFDESSPKLTIEQSAALGKLTSDPESQQGKRTDLAPTPPTLIPLPPKADSKASQREAARPAIPIIAQAAAERKLTPTIISALADAALTAPTYIEAVVEKAVTDKLEPDAIRHAAQILADPLTPPEISAAIVTPGAPVADRDGNMSPSEMERTFSHIAHMLPEKVAGEGNLKIWTILNKLDSVRGAAHDDFQEWATMASEEDWESLNRRRQTVEQFFADLCSFHEQSRSIRLVR